jgi:hypothetical protein
VPLPVVAVSLLVSKSLLRVGARLGQRRANRLIYQELQHISDVEPNKNGAQLSAIFFSKKV